MRSLRCHRVNEERGTKQNLLESQIEWESGWVNLAGKVKNLFLVTIDAYRLENRKMEVCRV